MLTTNSCNAIGAFRFTLARRIKSRLISGVRFLVAAIFITSAPLLAAQTILPIDSKDRHLGVATCAGSTCHGAPEPFESSPVLQNEFITWHRQDKHAQAYKVLLNKQSQRIAKNLGLNEAHTAKECLVCHTDYVDEDARGKRYQLSDGVGCEACHGGAERWLGLHVTGAASHEDNVKAGLYPTEDPSARATLCLSCHLGNVGERKITHRIMGAGHPRLSFELDTFTIIEPWHFKIDDDYRERKPVFSHAEMWALGQLSAAATFLGSLVNTKHQGITPELVYFDCQSCHHPMAYGDILKHPQRGWAPRRATGLGPGAVRLNDSTLLMVTAIARGVSKETGAKVQNALKTLHLATTQGWNQTRAAAGKLSNLIVEVRAQLTGKVDQEAIQAILVGILNDGRRGEYRDYAAAEQGYLALDSLLASLEQQNALSGAQSTSASKAMDALYATLRTPEQGYRPSKHGYKPGEDDKDVYIAAKYQAAMRRLAEVF